MKLDLRTVTIMIIIGSDLAKQLLGALEVGPDAAFTTTFVPAPSESSLDLPPKATTP